MIARLPSWALTMLIVWVWVAQGCGAQEGAGLAGGALNNDSGNNDFGNNANNDNGNNFPGTPGNNDPGNNDLLEVFQFVMITDLTPQAVGDFPGADIDAVSLIKPDSDQEFFVQQVSEQSDVECEGNQACDLSTLLGMPDAVTGPGECFDGGDPDATTFAALNQGFIIVTFTGPENGLQPIESGDVIHVYELGAVECGRFEDDPYRVSVGVSDTETGAFITVGENSDGSNLIPINGL